MELNTKVNMTTTRQHNGFYDFYVKQNYDLFFFEEFRIFVTSEKKEFLILNGIKNFVL